MTKRTRKLKDKNKVFDAITGKRISPNKEVICVANAIDYVKKQGYIVTLPKQYNSAVAAVLLILTIACLSMIIPFAHAGDIGLSTIDKSYDSAKNEITLSDGANTLLKARLATPSMNNVVRGKDRIIAEINISQIDDKKAYNEIFTGLTFKDLKGNTISKPYKIVARVDNGFNIVPITECQDKNCLSVKVVGQTFEPQYRWVEIKSISDIPKGSFILGIMTDVGVNEGGDWIINLYGKDLSEWALWNDSFQTNMIMAMPMNESSGNIFNSLNQSINATKTNTPTYGVNGAFGKAIAFNGANKDNFLIPATGDLMGSSITVSTWVKINSTSGAQRIFAGNQDNAGTYALLTNSGKLVCSFRDNGGNGQEADGTSTLALNTLYNLVCVFNATSKTASAYVNGTLEANSIAVGGTLNTARETRGIGVDPNYPNIQNFDGLIDELYVWREAKSSAFISQIAQYTFFDNKSVASTFTPTNITFISQSPSDINTNNANGGVNITYSLTKGNDSMSTLFLVTKVNNSVNDCFSFLNGSNFNCGYHAIVNATSNQSNQNFTFNLDHDFVYPASYNYDQEEMEALTKSGFNLNNANSWAYSEMLNLTNTKKFYFVWINIINNSVTSNPASVFYCNSTNSCTQIHQILATDIPEVTLSQSRYFIAPFVVNLSDGKVNEQVIMTPTSNIVVHSNTGGWTMRYITNNSRLGNSKTTANAGVSTTNLSGTFDIHVHFFNGTASLRYFAYSRNATANITTSERTDLLDIGGLIPTTPQIIEPSQASYVNSSLIPISWTQSISPNGYNISNYTISLYNSDMTFNRILATNTATNLSMDININQLNLSSALYIIAVNATDSINQRSETSFSNTFQVSYTTTPVVITNIFSFDLSNNQNMALFIFCLLISIAVLVFLNEVLGAIFIIILGFIAILNISNVFIGLIIIISGLFAGIVFKGRNNN